MNPKYPTMLFRIVLGLLLIASFQPTPSAGLARPALQPAQPAYVSSAAVFSTIDAGWSHTCALTLTNGVQCWGNNSVGKLGDGTETSRSFPGNVSTLSSGVQAFSAGGYHTCALTTQGGVKCWGFNEYGQLGFDNSITYSTTPVNVTGLSSGVRAISAGGWHTCALMDSGGVKCWGNLGMLNGGPTPVDVNNLGSGVIAISAGSEHTCALTTGGAVKCWGRNSEGQLGNNGIYFSSEPVDVINLGSGVATISAGFQHTCASTNSGAAWCWGLNESGQLGDGTQINRKVPVSVSNLSNGVSGITSGSDHTCAWLTGGAVKCWGANLKGQLGNGTITASNTPVNVSGLASGVTALTAGTNYTCALIAGAVKCWGDNSDGVLGDGLPLLRAIPAQVSGLDDTITRFDIGWRHTCAILAGGMKCWGDNESGQLGDGTYINRATPVTVGGLPGIPTDMALGYGHTCAVALGGAYCWGDDSNGQLGDNFGESTTPTPKAVIGLSSDLTHLSAGMYHTCVLTTGGGVHCWGAGYDGQLGNGSNDGSGIPVGVYKLSSGASAIVAGGEHTCVLVSSKVRCWGFNYYGQLGNGTEVDSNVPVTVTNLTGVTALAAGYNYTCALTAAGSVKCWGGPYGNIPADVYGLSSGVNVIAAGSFHTCALLSGGKIKCLGYNDFGQLGDGSTSESDTLVDVSGLSSGATALAAGGEHTCAMLGDTVMKCWGQDTFGELGTGRSLMQLTPAPVASSLTPFLSLNYNDGPPGSFFTVTGWNYPAGQPQTLYVNGRIIATFNANMTGSFVIFLDTSGLSNDAYTVSVGANPGASAAFTLSHGATLRPQEGGGMVYRLASLKSIHLPLVRR
jgi:alpha-tubulin suppressor-like RCC1 family protein